MVLKPYPVNHLQANNDFYIFKWSPYKWLYIILLMFRPAVLKILIILPFKKFADPCSRS